MDRKYLNNIELDKIVEKAAGRAVCPETHVLLHDEMPFTALFEVREQLAQTDALARHLLRFGSPRISSCEAADRAVSRAAKGGVLSVAELLNVNSTLRNFSALVSWYSSGREDGQMRAPSPVDNYFNAIIPQPQLEKDILAAILNETEMADTASDELYSLRRKIRQAESSIRDKLDAVVKSPANAKFLQESIVSIRNGRFVVPVRSEHRGEVAGVIHDVSQSGGTVFVEPAAVVEANAKIMQLRNAERAEMERILGEFSQRVADIAPQFHAGWDAMLQLDMKLAKAALALEMDAVCPDVNETQRFSLVKARHPLLPKGTAVPVDIALGGDTDTLVITGPNTGGKTVALKTAGLLCAMAQSGYLIPAHDSSTVCVFENILVDIGDEQSIEQSLSTFSGHIRNITGILVVANRHSLALLDELGAGTDPAEGAALAIAIVERLRACGALVMATTHYAELKLFALDTEGVQNAGSEFNVETLRPTYRLVMGVPGRSNAFLIGEKLGIPGEVIERARRHLSAEQRRFETVLTQLEDMKLEIKRQEDEIEHLRYVAAHQLEEAQKKRDELIRQGEEELSEARRKAKSLADDVQNQAYRLMDEMKQLEKDARRTNAQKAQRARQIAKNEADMLGRHAADGAIQTPLSFEPLTAAVPGDEVWVPGMGMAATVSAAPDKNGQVELRIGAIKTKLPLSELAKKPKTQQAKARGQSKTTMHREATPNLRAAGSELNLLGRTVEEALMETDAFIDQAVMNGLGTVWLIHGRGTGALRSAIAQHLKGIRSVKSFRLGRYGEGEDGVTVVELK